METIKNVARIQVVTQAHTFSASDTVDNLSAGEVAICSGNGKLIDGYSNVTAGAEYKVVSKTSDGKLLFSDPIVKGAETLRNYSAYSASTPKIAYVGFNGSAGSVDVVNNNIYTVRLYLKDNTTDSFMRNLIKEGYFESGDSDTQPNIVGKLVDSLQANFKRDVEVKNLVKFEVVINNAGVATSGGAFTVVQGSKYVTTVESAGAAADAGQYNADGSDIAVGDYIRFGTGLTDGVYKVVSITGTTAAKTILLDRPVEVTSGSKAANTVEVIAAADAASADFGIKVTSVKKTYVKGLFNSDPYVDFELTIQGGGDTTVTVSQGVSKGIGTYEWVAEREFEWQMGEYLYRDAIAAPEYRSEASSSSTYGIFNINFKDDMTTDLGGKAISHKQLYVAVVAANVAGVQTLLGIS